MTAATPAFPARISIVTLGVTDLAASTAFYQALGWSRSAASNDNIVWFRTADSALGLFPPRSWPPTRASRRSASPPSAASPSR